MKRIVAAIDAVLEYLRTRLFRDFHHWAALWSFLLLTFAVVVRMDGVVIGALVGLCTAMIGSSGLVHGMKHVAGIKYGNGKPAPAVPGPEPRPQE